MKLLSRIVLAMLVFVLHSCSTGDVTCYCNNGTASYRNYTLGKRVAWNEAVARCGAIQHNDNWDTCLVMEPK